MFEKEVLGIYVSGHPLEEYENMWRRQISALSTDFALNEETGRSIAIDGRKEIIGGIVEEKTIKYTRQNKTMAFITLEDLVGSVEVIVFPNAYERYHTFLEEDAKLFIEGRVSAEDEKASKLIGERIWRFEDVPRDVWIQFDTMEEYERGARGLADLIRESDGKDEIVIYVKEAKAIRRLGPSQSVRADAQLLEALRNVYGADNVKVTERRNPGR